jgi:hypothetical protein
VTVLVFVALLGLLFFPRFWLLAAFVVLQAGISALALSAAWNGANSASRTPIPDQLFWQSDSLWSALLRLVVLIAVGVAIVSARKLWRTHKSDRAPTESSADSPQPQGASDGVHREGTVSKSAVFDHATEPARKPNWRRGLGRVALLSSVVWWIVAGVILYEDAQYPLSAVSTHETDRLS